MKSSYEFKLDQQMDKQVELEHVDDTLVVRIAYRVGNSVRRDEIRIAVVGVPRFEAGSHGVEVTYRERPFRMFPWLTIPRSRFF